MNHIHSWMVSPQPSSFVYDNTDKDWVCFIMTLLYYVIMKTEKLISKYNWFAALTYDYKIRSPADQYTKIFSINSLRPVTHIWVCKLTSIVSDNGLAHGRRQAIIWTNAGILLIGPLGTTAVKY